MVEGRGRSRARTGLPASAALVLLVALLPAAAPAEITAETTGWWRLRYHFYDGVPVDRDPAGTQTEFLDHRGTLDTTVAFGDGVSLKSRLLLIDDVLFGNNEADVSILTGLTRATSNLTHTDELEPEDDIKLERLWAEVLTPVGLIRAGRQPSNWGLGILANSGDPLEWGPEGNGSGNGDTLDRLSFLTDLAVALGWEDETWLVAAAYDRAIENQVVSADDDVHQLVLASLSTDGSISPRVVGTREVGAYVVWVTGDQWNSDLALFDGYVHLEVGDVFVEAEGLVALGQTQRGGLIPGDDREEAEENLAESIAEDFVETLNGTLSLADAQRYARDGFPPFLQSFAATELFASGFSRDVALAISERGVAEGLPIAFAEEIDVLIYGGVVRGGWNGDGLRLRLEAGYSSPTDANDFAAVRVGPEGSRDADLDLALEDNLDDLTGERALTGRDFGAYPFDSEYDVALLLYEVAGPINPASGNPGVFNTVYGKVTMEWQATDDLVLWGSVVAGWLNEPVVIVTDRLHPDDPVEFVHDEDDTNQIVIEERALGVELDLGAVWTLHEHLKAEVKAGYLRTGESFGPHREDVFGIRPQVALTF